MEDLKDRLRQRALAEGFSAMGVCRPDAIPEAAGRLRAFVEAGRHGQMGWMEERMTWRGDPAALWPEARSVVMLAEVYTPGHDPMAVLDRPDRGAVSVYAHGRDYHDLVKKRLKRVGRWLLEEAGSSAQDGDRVTLSSSAPHASAAHAAKPVVLPKIKVFVDTAPVMEKPLAQAAGLGWQGKHTNLLSRELGNWFFLGAIFTTIDLAPDAAEEEHCGTCRKCLDICPTNAFPAPFQLDARRCVSYLTIEHEGPVDEALRPGLGNRIYGCDDCLAVCPWNKFARSATEMRYLGDPEPPRLAELAALDDAAFRARYSGSAVKRIGSARFLRNVLYAIGNSGDVALTVSAAAHLDHEEATVRDAARWALARLGNRGGD
jgi:epoxyqueuosine reductase